MVKSLRIGQSNAAKPVEIQGRSTTIIETRK